MTNPKVPITRVVICVFASKASFASPKSETCKRGREVLKKLQACKNDKLKEVDEELPYPCFKVVI